MSGDLDLGRCEAVTYQVTLTSVRGRDLHATDGQVNNYCDVGIDVWALHPLATVIISLLLAVSSCFQPLPAASSRF